MNTKLLINSTINYNKSLKKLLTSLSQCENRYKNEDIIIIKAGGNKYKTTLINGLTIITADNNSFDFTALIAVNDLDIQATGFLYIHDTCVLGNQFFNKANNKGYDHEMIALKPGSSMNIGYYSKKCLTDNKELLDNFKNQDYTPQGLEKTKTLAVDYEDIISNKYKTEETVYQNHEPEITGPTDYYNTGTLRITEYYAGLDLYKIKANYCKLDNWVIKP